MTSRSAKHDRQRYHSDKEEIWPQAMMGFAIIVILLVVARALWRVL